MILNYEYMKSKKKINIPKPMSVEELNARIDRSEEDFKNNRFKTSADLLSKYK